MTDKKYINIKRAAEIIGVSELTLRNWDKAGKFIAFRHPINNYRMYTKEQIDDLMGTVSKREVVPKAHVANIETPVIVNPEQTPTITQSEPTKKIEENEPEKEQPQKKQKKVAIKFLED